jgi:tripeptide aminopeptidase
MESSTARRGFDSDAVDRVLRLMAIPGRSGEESAIRNAVVAEAVAAGLPDSAVALDDLPKRSPHGGDSGNLVIKLPGTVRGPRRLLMAHLDTVPLCVGSRPTLKGTTIRSADPKTALGGDNRSGVAVLLSTLVEILRKGLPHPPLTFFFPVQEEVGLIGARFVRTSLLGNPKLCFNWDGGDSASVTLGATGAYHLDIAIDGVASHAGVHPERGVSAIAIAGLAIADLQSNGWHGLVQKGRKTGTSNLGVVSGGDATNVVTARVNLRGEVRSHDPAFRKRLLREFESAFQRACKLVRSSEGHAGKLTFHAELKYESFRIPTDSPSVVAATEAIRTHTRRDPEFVISNGGLDANWLTAHGYPCVTLGAGQSSVHTTAESLDTGYFLQACRIGLHLATAGQASV